MLLCLHTHCARFQFHLDLCCMLLMLALVISPVARVTKTHKGRSIFLYFEYIQYPFIKLLQP